MFRPCMHDPFCMRLSESLVVREPGLLQAPSVPAEEPLTEPLNQDLDVSDVVVDASYR